MNNWIQATLERRRFRPQRRRFPATSIPMLFLLGGLLIWGPDRASGQFFGISPITNTSVLVGTPLTIQISVTNTTGANIPLTWTLSSNPTTDAILSPLSTGPLDPTTFSWTPTQAQAVLFTVS